MTSFGTVTSLGVGSGFDLQGMLEDFREIDEAPINRMRDEIVVIEERLTKFTEINAKLLDMKSHALALSLQSNFIERSVSVSDEEVATATAIAGAAPVSSSLEVLRIARRNSWQTAGVASLDTSTYIPTIQESTTGFDDTDQSVVIPAADALTLTYGSGDTLQTINIDLSAGMTLDQVMNAINTDSQNDDGEGSTHVTASTFEDEEGLWNLRLSSTAEGSTESNRVMVTGAPQDLGFSAPDVIFTYTVGDREPVSVSVPADTSFTDLAILINEDENNAGVTASVINDGTGETPYRLVLTADSTGEDNRIAIGGIQMTEVQGADGDLLNAEISIDGILYQRQTNTDIDDIIQGVSITLVGEGTATITVDNDYDLVRTEILGLVESYNTLIQDIKISSAYDTETEEWGILAPAYSIKGLSYELNGLMSSISSAEDTTISSMYDLGMAINRDGTITIDEAALDEALSTGADQVAALFLSDEDTNRTGLADLINVRLRDITSSSGLMGTEQSYAENEIDRLKDSIESATDRLDRRYDILIRQFVELDKYLGLMKAESKYLDTIFESITDGQSKK